MRCAKDRYDCLDQKDEPYKIRSYTCNYEIFLFVEQ